MYFNYNICACSGDTDGKVPLLSRYGLQEIKLNVRKEWRARFEGRQVGGWVEGYEVATIKGVDHQVPIFAPQEALSIFSYFLSSQSLPSSPF